jgi:DNA replication initiation complex subunit (GINS family)
MKQDDINYKTLRKIQQQEKNSSLIMKIDQNFYVKFSEYLKNLRKIAEKEKDAEKLNIFNDEIKNTEKIALNIYELREKKIVQAALSTVRGGKPDLKHILNVEKKLYESIIEQISLSRKTIIDLKKEKTPEATKKSELKKEEQPQSNTNTIVQVLENTPEFVGTDMKTYTLRKDDVLTMPKEMCAPLIQRGVVKQIK